ncbi:MAG: hypothetical protein ACXAC5_02775 [Promethearchaeota archaeon]|jgi:hypothetical protein
MMVVIVFFDFSIDSWNIAGPYVSKEQAEYFFKHLPPKVQEVAETVFIKQLAMALKLHEKLS